MHLLSKCNGVDFVPVLLSGGNLTAASESELPPPGRYDGNVRIVQVVEPNQSDALLVAEMISRPPRSRSAALASERPVNLAYRE